MNLPREVFAVKFRNPLGLSGMDHLGEYFNQLADFGFGFVSIGPFTTKDHRSSILSAVKTIRSAPVRTVLSLTLARDPSHTSDEDILEDYRTPFTLLYDFVDMVIVDMYAPEPEFITDILDELLSLRLCYDVSKPILIKVSPDIETEQLDHILDYALYSGVDGIVATNTTRSREGLRTSPERLEDIGRGGLSGAPLFEKSLSLVRYIHEKTLGRLPIIGCGGISTPEQAEAMLAAGASLIEVYTGFIYEGPGMVRRILKHLENKSKANK